MLLHSVLLLFFKIDLIQVFLQDRPDLLLQIFDLGSEGGENEVDGEMLSETDEVPYECGARYVKALTSEWPLR